MTNRRCRRPEEGVRRRSIRHAYSRLAITLTGATGGRGTDVQREHDRCDHRGRIDADAPRTVGDTDEVVTWAETRNVVHVGGDDVSISVAPLNGASRISTHEVHGHRSVAGVRTARSTVGCGEHFAVRVGDGHQLLNSATIGITHRDQVDPRTEIGGGGGATHDSTQSCQPFHRQVPASTAEGGRGRADAYLTLARGGDHAERERRRFGDGEAGGL